jgi:hypothetical protein
LSQFGVGDTWLRVIRMMRQWGVWSRPSYIMKDDV